MVPFRFAPRRGFKGQNPNRWTFAGFLPAGPDPACEVGASYALLRANATPLRILRLPAT